MQNRNMLSVVAAATFATLFAVSCTRDTTPAVMIDSNPPVVDGMLRGDVVETFDSGGYTYVMIMADGVEVWAAASAQKVELGEQVTFATTMPVKDFHSPSLNRTFDSIYFVSSLKEGAVTANAALPAGHPPLGGGDTGLPPGHPPMEPRSEALPDGHPPLGGGDAGLPPGHPPMEPRSEALPAGHPPLGTQRTALPHGHPPTTPGAVLSLPETREVPGQDAPSAQEPLASAPEGTPVPIADLHENKETWRDKNVVVRGEVTKATPNILGKNWVHLTDKDGQKVVITTRVDVGMGQDLIVKGRVALDKDIGAGYVYDILVEDADVFPVK